MPRYFFHLFGEVPARDAVGHECADDNEATAHGNFIAHRIGTERPEMVRDGNSITVANERDGEIAKIPLASTTAQ